MANIIPSPKGYRGKSPEDQEAFEFYERLRRGDQALRVLEEHEATEGGPMVPTAALAQIESMKPEYSLIDLLGIRRLKTDKLITQIPVEVTGQALPADILEEAVHVANEPAFALRTITVTKWGSMITCTEELLEDQALFQSWFPAACARRMALQENVQLYATLAAGGTLGVHLAAANTLTEAELFTFYSAMPDPWRDGAKIVTCTANMLSMRALLIASPRAFAPAPEFNTTAPNGAQPRAHWMGMPMFLNSNWPTLAAAVDAVEVITMVNPIGILFVQRHGIEVVRDDYGDALNGRTRFFPTARWCMDIGDPLSVVHLTDHVV